MLMRRSKYRYSKKKISELAIQNALEKYFLLQGYRVCREVETSVGRVDLVVYTDKEKILIETKERGGLKGAIGQVVMYAQHERSDRHVIVWFTYDGVYRSIDTSYEDVCRRSGIELYSIHKYISLEDLLKEQELVCPERMRERIEGQLVVEQRVGEVTSIDYLTSKRSLPESLTIKREKRENEVEESLLVTNNLLVESMEMTLLEELDWEYGKGLEEKVQHGRQSETITW